MIVHAILPPRGHRHGRHWRCGISILPSGDWCRSLRCARCGSHAFFDARAIVVQGPIDTARLSDERIPILSVKEMRIVVRRWDGGGGGGRVWSIGRVVVEIGGDGGSLSLYFLRLPVGVGGEGRDGIWGRLLVHVVVWNLRLAKALGVVVVVHVEAVVGHAGPDTSDIRLGLNGEGVASRRGSGSDGSGLVVSSALQQGSVPIRGPSPRWWEAGLGSGVAVLWASRLREGVLGVKSRQSCVDVTGWKRDALSTVDPWRIWARMGEWLAVSVEPCRCFFSSLRSRGGGKRVEKEPRDASVRRVR